MKDTQEVVDAIVKEAADESTRQQQEGAFRDFYQSLIDEVSFWRKVFGTLAEEQPELFTQVLTLQQMAQLVIVTGATDKAAKAATPLFEMLAKEVEIDDGRH